MRQGVVDENVRAREMELKDETFRCSAVYDCVCGEMGDGERRGRKMSDDEEREGCD
jgi:hypothetical protein